MKRLRYEISAVFFAAFFPMWMVGVLYLPYITNGPAALRISTAVSESSIEYETPFTATATIDNVARIVWAEDMATCLEGRTGTFWWHEGFVWLRWFVDGTPGTLDGADVLFEHALNHVGCM